MVAGLAFLSKKSFNPKNLSNQKRVWEKREEKAVEEKKARDRARQLQREKDEEELARVRDGSHGAAKSALKFMYDAPPTTKSQPKEEQRERSGYPEKPSSVINTTEGNNAVSNIALLKRQPGDDDAAAAFRQMLAAAAQEQEEQSDDEQRNSNSQGVGETYSFSNSSGAALQGSTEESKQKNEAISALEKAVGKRTTAGMTLEEQIARFPQLKDAPMAKGMTSTNVNVSFKPLGTQLRNVRCLACGVWGHSRGERECKLSGWDPFAITNASVTKPTAGTITVRGIANSTAQSTQPTTSGLTGKERTEPKQINEEDEDEDEDRRRRRKKKSHRKRRRRDDYSASDASSLSDTDSSAGERRRRRKKERKRHRKHRKERKRSKRDSWRDRSPEDGRQVRKSRHERNATHIDPLILKRS